MIDSIPKEWEIIVIDGRWTGNKAPDKFSSKDLRDKVESYKNVTLVDGNDMEFEARNQYFERAEMFDILITIDSDEWIGTLNEELFYNYINNLDGGMHYLEFSNTHKSGSRLYVNPFEWRYYKSHKYLKHNGKIQQINRPDSMVNGIELLTNDDLRTEEMIKYINDYQKQLWKYEDTLNFDN